MKAILLMICAILPGVKSDFIDVQDCASLEINYTAKLTNNQVTIDIQAKGGVEPYFYFFFDKKNNPLTWDFKKHELIVEKDQTPKLLKVFDSKGCFKEIDFNESSIK